MSAPLVELVSSRASLAGVSIAADQLDQLVAYYTLLERWNQKINLTALPLTAREPTTIDRLLIEPLIAAPRVEDARLIWFDFGSGGGSPAVPLKLLRPKMRLTMVEAKERKSAFLREAVRTLNLTMTDVFAGRIEVLERSAEGAAADLVTMRAVKAEPEVLDAARKILKLHGQLLLFRGADVPKGELPGFELVAEKSLPSTGILSAYRRVSE